jgi:hypothetical protein
MHGTKNVKKEIFFITSVVPLQLHSTKISRIKFVLWKNPRPSSVRYCRPTRIQFKKETTRLAKEEIYILKKE